MSTEAERSSPLPAGVPSRIGSYVIKRVIASGGMGTVFEALQENPRRPVAVKVIKEPLASEGAIGRLEYEAQILARLRHPGIAQIYEAGSFEDRGSVVPFFAMEYIPNAHNITAYARDKQLDHRQRLELFLQVCEAVHHGHQRGIVHRDLKPSNILVDSSGRVRIIDFGVARATDSDTKRAGAHTEYGSLVGSVQYMSPEQFDADPHDIDTRSDVYALGVVLYELLAGSLPYQTNSKRVFDIVHGYGATATVTDVLDSAGEKVGEAFPAEPEVEAEIRRSLGRGYMSVSNWGKAQQHLKAALELRRQSLGPTHDDTIQSTRDLNRLYEVTDSRRKRLELMRDSDVEFATIKEDGSLWNHFGCDGVPSLWLLHEGTLIWDHQGLSDDRIAPSMLEGMASFSEAPGRS